MTHFTVGHGRGLSGGPFVPAPTTNRTTLMHNALVELRRVLREKTRTLSRAELLAIIEKGMGE